MARDIVWNLVADSSKFASGTRAAAKAANELFVSTRTSSERFALEVGKLQSIQDKLDPDTFMRAYRGLEEKYDPFGNQERMKESKARTAAMLESERAAVLTGRQKFLAMLDQDVIDTRMDKIARRSRTAGQEVEAFGSKSMRANMAIQQLAFGLEDAASQYGTMGLAGAIRGASNNISAAAMMMGPQAAVIGALTSTVAMLGAQYFASSQNAEKLAKSQDMLGESANRLDRELDEREKNYALRFRLEDIGNMSKESAAAERRKALRDAEILQIRKEGVELTAIQGIRQRARAEQARIEFQQKYEGFDQDRYNRNVELERVQRMTTRDLLSRNPDLLPTGLLNDEEIKTLKKKQEEYRNLTVEIGSANAARREAYEIEQRESRRAYDNAAMDAQWAVDQKRWEEASHWIEKTKTVGDRFREALQQIDKLDDPFLDKQKARAQAVRDAFGDMRSPLEKHREFLKDLSEVERSGALNAAESIKIRRKAASELVPQRILSGALDVRTSEGAQAMGAAYEQAMRQSMIASFAGTPSKPPDPQQAQVVDNTKKANELLGKIVSELARQPRVKIRKVGLN